RPVAAFGEPWGHGLSLNDPLDGFGVGLRVVVGEEIERGRLAGTVALLTIVLDDAGDAVVESNRGGLGVGLAFDYAAGGGSGGSCDGLGGEEGVDGVDEEGSSRGVELVAETVLIIYSAVVEEGAG